MKRIISILIFFVAPMVFGESLVQRRIVEFTSPDFKGAELQRLARSLGLKVGARIDQNRLDKRIRALYKGNRFQMISVEAERFRKGIRVILRGAKSKRIREVKFTDVEKGVIEEIRGTGLLKAGEYTDARLFTELRERLLRTYEERGFYSVSVRVQIKDVPGTDQADIEIVVDRQQQTNVGEVRITGVHSDEHDRLKELLLLERGEAFSRSALENTVAAINDYLKKHQYLTSKVEETSLSFSDDKTVVDIDIFVKLGQEYQFFFDGNSVFSSVQLREMMTSELLSQVNASTRIADSIEKKYKEVGFHFARVRVEDQIDRENMKTVIRFDVDEGERVVIDRVILQGDVRVVGEEGLMDESDVIKTFLQGGPGVIPRRVYWEQGLPIASNTMEKYLKGIGYLNARVAVHKVEFWKDQSGVDLYVRINLGTRTVISGVQFNGIRHFEKKALTDKLPFAVGKPLNLDSVKKGKAEVLREYREAGYIDVELKETENEGLLVSRDQENVIIDIGVKEGPRYYVGAISVEGNKKTEDLVILRELRLQEGDVYNPKLVQESEEAISLLGLFGRVQILSTESAGDPTRKDLKVVVRETNPGSGELGLGGLYEDPRFRLRAFAGLSYRNVSGLNNTASVRGEVRLPVGDGRFVDFIEFLTLLGYSAPYPFGIPVNFFSQVSVDSFLISTSDAGLDTFRDRARIEGRIEKQLTKTLRLIYRIYNLEITQVREETGNPGDPVDETVDVIGSTGPGLILDLRDSPVNPKSGSLHSIDVEFAHPYLGSRDNIAFLMSRWRNTFFVPLFEPFSVVLYGGLGWAGSLNPGVPLPEARLTSELALGGQRSIRGFRPLVFNATNVESVAYYNFRSELWIAMFSGISAVIFFDTGQLFPNVTHDTVNFPRRDGVGFGFRYETPVGPIAFDVGIGVAEGTQLRYYFTVGTL